MEWNNESRGDKTMSFPHDPALGWKTMNIRHADTAIVHDRPDSRILIDLESGLVDVTVDNGPPMAIHESTLCHGQWSVECRMRA